MFRYRVFELIINVGSQDDQAMSQVLDIYIYERDRGTWEKPHQTDKLPQLLRAEPSTDSSIELLNRVSLVNIIFSGF